MQEIKAWLDKTRYKNFEIELASADASFRQYFRLRSRGESYILMDSSQEKASLLPFIDITKRLLEVDVRAPKILAQNLEAGFLILDDFGNINYLDVLNDQNFRILYTKAMEEILKMQKGSTAGLPLYDKAFLHFEMELMKSWFLEQYVKLPLSIEDEQIIEDALNAISEVVLTQPQNVFVHRDYHSRNIMLTHEAEIGVIDYQDAMSGAITYDLVSLLKDLYIEYPKDEVRALALQFRDMLGLEVDNATFIKWFDFMGLQRHIKVLGIFARLYLRDGKEGYLKDLPLTLRYTIETAAQYEETKALSDLLKKVVLP
ncbi:MAG: phosphotransferase [Helicobacteraceae bacterium]|nr:phosphotransferase [Helicobacteraceae bacterium]